MKNIVFFSFLFLMFSCKQTIHQADIEKLNGYWEIQSVSSPELDVKEYKVNETIDYFEIKNNIGFRKKVMPQLDGKYLVNDLQENIKITTKDGDFFIQYKTDYATWKEQIVELIDSVLVLKNAENKSYQYKRAIPFSIK